GYDGDYSFEADRRSGRLHPSSLSFRIRRQAMAKTPIEIAETVISKQISSAAPRKLAASLLSVALVAFATAGAAPQASAQLLTPDDFYTPPATLPAKPGDIVRSRAVDAPLFPEANVWQIMYRSS